MGKGGGGGVDTSGLEKATEEATALQRMIYEQTRDDVQPWYQMGAGAVGRLSDLLGISGGQVQSRDQIYNELLPQYTTTVQNQSNLVTDNSGRTYDLNSVSSLQGLPPDIAAMMDYVYDEQGNTVLRPRDNIEGIGSASESVNYDALNSAVDARLGEQGVPSDYGSLLQRFGMDQFEEDPGYQFRQDESNKALERAMAAQGVTLGGGGYGEINPQAYRAMEELNQNLASQEYGNAYNRYVQDQLNTFNMLTGAAGMGQGSTGILATGGQNYANNVGNLQTGLAGAQLNAQMSQQAQPSMFGSLLGAGAGAFLGNPGLGAAAGKAIFG